MENEKELTEIALDLARENKGNAKAWKRYAIISNLVILAVFTFIVIYGVNKFFEYESQFEYEVEKEVTTTTTTVSQDTGEGEGNNVYQAGEYATYNEGGDKNGEANYNNENDKDNDENKEG